MKIVIPGGSGQVGTILARSFARDGHDVVVIGRKAGRDGPARSVIWDGATVGDWAKELDGADVVINLAGRSVDCRYTAANRRAIMDSRVDSTRAVAAAIRSVNNPPRVWLQMSTATIYAHRYDGPNDEITGIVGGAEPDAPSTWNFSIDVAHTWEKAATDAALPSTRLVLLRSAMVMSPDRGGVFDVLLGLVRKGLGGTSGDGRQFMSWIHDVDFVAAVRFLIDRDDLAGPVNLSSPHPLPNADFMRELRRAWGTRLGLPAARWMLSVGAMLMRTETELVQKSRRVVPTRLARAGFDFRFPEWKSAATDLCRRWRETKNQSAT